MYNDIKDLAKAIVDQDDALSFTGTLEGQEWKRLYVVYNNALSNPPVGVIGVGAISYAEGKLKEAQA